MNEENKRKVASLAGGQKAPGVHCGLETYAPFPISLLFYFLYIHGYVKSVFQSKNIKMFVFFVLLASLLTPPDPLTEISQFFCFLVFFRISYLDRYGSRV